MFIIGFVRDMKFPDISGRSVALPRPWPKISAPSNDYGMGEVRYQRNGQRLFFQNLYEIEVQPGDSLSKYSMILYGNFNQIDAFARPKQPGLAVYDLNDIKPIVNPNLIHVGELLYHIPTIEENNDTSGAVQIGAGYQDLNLRDAPNVALPSGIEIIAYDNYDFSGAGEYWTTFGNTTKFTDVQSFVQGVLSAASGQKIKLLHIQAHGDSSGIYFGDCGQSIPTYRYPWSAAPNGNYVHVGVFNNYRAEFAKLRPHFADGAWVVFRSCKTGWAQGLLREFRSLWGVNVLAGKGLWNNVSDSNDGDYVIYEKGGGEYRTTTLPWALQHDTLRAKGWRDNPSW
ncbi:MAG: hypothetical protein KDE55_02940 [Novosphingobium sp.]|nr:hypothetical protein [Novosphingobium sp.]